MQRDVITANFLDADDGAETFLAHEIHLVGHVGEDGRRIPVSGSRQAVAALEKGMGESFLQSGAAGTLRQLTNGGNSHLAVRGTDTQMAAVQMGTEFRGADW